MIILRENKIERSFSGDVLSDNINIQVDGENRIALVGRNGAGKSTLFGISVGEEALTSDEISAKRDLTLSYLVQDSRFESENTIFGEMLHAFDDVRGMESRLRKMEMQMVELTGDALDKLMSDYDRMSEEFHVKGGFTYETEIKAILDGFKFNESMWQMGISELSGGQNTHLALAKMLLEKPKLLVLDKPANHLDIETITWPENYLVDYQGALIIASHDRYFLDKVATVTLDLTPHSLDRYAGNHSKFMDLKAEKLALEVKSYEKQAKEIAKLGDFVRRNIVRASTAKRARACRKQLEKMERLDKPAVGQESTDMTFHTDKVSGNVVLTVTDATIGYDNQILSEPIDIDIKKFDAIAIVEPNGIGKSTLIKPIMGQIPFIKGTLTCGINVEVGYYDQTQSNLTRMNTVLDELWDDFPATPKVGIRNRLGAFFFSGDDIKKSINMLSGGEHARLLLTKLSIQDDNFFILDKPTNHLDIDSKEVLEDTLIDFDGTLLFISHDRYFIDCAATKVLETSEKGSTPYLGDYDYYLEKKAELEEMERLKAEEAQEKTVTIVEKEPANDYQMQKANQKELRKLTRRIAEIEDQLEDIEAREETINQAMLATNDAVELVDLQKEFDDLTEQQETFMLEWEGLSEQAEG